MGNEQSPAQTVFMGLSREQVAKILYEEFSKSGFQFNNINAMIPPIIGRVLMENGGMAGNNFNAMIPSIISRALMGSGGMAGNNLTEMFFKGMMGNFFKK